MLLLRLPLQGRIRAIVQFRASIGVLDCDLPFSQAFGIAKTRAHCGHINIRVQRCLEGHEGGRHSDRLCIENNSL
jgi:hypothetical protein